MIEIKCVKDVKALSARSLVPEEIVEKIYEELAVIKKWSDEYDEVDINDYNAEDFGYGYIVVLEGNETEAEIKEIGLTEGLEGVIPEAAESFYVGKEKWTRIIVVYNDSYSMSFWLKNSNQFDDYAVISNRGLDDEKSEIREAF